MNILLAVDGSSFSCKAVSYIASHLQWFRGEPRLHLLHVKLPIPPGLAVEQARRILGDDSVNGYYRETAEAALLPAETILREKGIPFQSGYEVGDIAHTVRAYAQKNGIDLIVMGSHGHGALANVLLGSVATRILAATTLPVLIVR
ncbi:universal stress protein [Noviherbaspirillum sp.]|uniref:universal stress protein n=1 Tax=Noviherbaspirillum sp. TaxID=1926288 RepID=UPI002FE3C0C1